MALSDRDRQVLAEMEQQLASEDPRLVSRLRTEGVGHARRVGAGVSLLLCGLAGLLAGVMLGAGSIPFATIIGPLVGVVGFLLMVFGVAWIIGGLGLAASGQQGSAPAPSRRRQRWENRDFRT